MFPPATLLSAVPVPFDTNGDLDVKGQETLLRHLKDTGIGGVFIAGTTGEFTALDDDERAAVLNAALDVYGVDAVYTHVGAAAARQAERLTPRAGGTGAVSGVSSVFPRPFLDLADALHRSDDQAAAAAQDRIKQAVDAVNGADVALLKAGLSLQGLPAGPTRVALDKPTPAQLETLRTAVEDLT